MSKRVGLSLTIVWILLSCTPAEPPVARLSMQPEAIELTYPRFVEVTLDWEVTAALGEAPTKPRIFLHLLDSEGELVRTFDHDFPRTWVGAGEEVVYDVKLSQSVLVPPLAEGAYALTVGLTDEAGNRWPLNVRGEEVHPGEYRIATVTAKGAGSSPKFFFSPAWLPVEGGTDLQVLARRWLAEDGVLRLSEIPASGVLYVGVGIPRSGGPQELVIEAPATEPAIRVTTTCGDYEAEVSGSGSHTLEVPVVVVDGPETTCDVSFVANYYLLSRDNMSRRTMALEELSWGTD